MKMIKRLSGFFLALLLVSSLAVTALAADSSITYEGHNIFGFGPGSEFTDTDLFDNFKGVMPGDVLIETVTVRNEASCCDFVKIYIRADAHDSSNPLSSKVAERETVVSMQDFLNQLSMTVWNGEQKILKVLPMNWMGCRTMYFLVPSAATRVQHSRFSWRFRPSLATSMPIVLAKWIGFLW